MEHDDQEAGRETVAIVYPYDYIFVHSPIWIRARVGKDNHGEEQSQKHSEHDEHVPRTPDAFQEIESGVAVGVSWLVGVGDLTFLFPNHHEYDSVAGKDDAQDNDVFCQEANKQDQTVSLWCEFENTTLEICAEIDDKWDAPVCGAASP